MQILGLSDSTPRTEPRWRSLFWPTIRNSTDYDYVTRQGFWICFIIFAVTLLTSLFTGAYAGLVDAVFYLLAAVGVRERSRAAAMAAFGIYVLGALVQLRIAGRFSILSVIFMALLFANIRGNWLSSKWTATQDDAAPTRMNQTVLDKLVDQFPIVVWPATKYIFYVLAVLEAAALLYAGFRRAD